MRVANLACTAIGAGVISDDCFQVGIVLEVAFRVPEAVAHENIGGRVLLINTGVQV